MSLVETLVRVAVGSVLGFQSSLGAQNFLLRRQQSEADKERIYSPLYDEIAGGLELLEKHDSLQTPEWDRISKQDHLTYRIGDAVLQKDLRQFYGPTLPLFNLKEGLCTSFYPALVVSDLNGRLRTRRQRLPSPMSRGARKQLAGICREICEPAGLCGVRNFKQGPQISRRE